MLFANLMKDGRIVGWAQTFMQNGQGALRTAKYGERLLSLSLFLSHNVHTPSRRLRLPLFCSHFAYGWVGRRG